MVAQKESQIVIPLNEGFVEDLVEDVANGATTQSLNTRLSVIKGTIARRPAIEQIDVAPALPAGEPCGAMAVGPGNSIAAYFKAFTGQKRISAGQVDPLVSQLDATQPQNAWYPYQIVDSGEAFTVRGGHPPSVAIDTYGNTWMCVLGTSGQSRGIYVTVYNSSGEIIAPQQLVATPTTAKAYPQDLYLWTCITAAGSSGAVNLWYANDTQILGTRLALAGSVVSVAVGPSVIATPAASSYIEASVCVNSTNSAYILYRHPTTATSARVSQVSCTTLAVAASLDLASVIAAGGLASFACTYVDVTPVPKLLVAMSHSAGVIAYFRVINAGTLTVVATNAYTGTFTMTVAIQPFLTSTITSVILAASRQSEAPLTGGDCTNVHFRVYDMQTGTFINECVVPWVFCVGNGSHHVAADAEIYPYFPVAPFLYSSLGGYGPTVGNYVPDPAIHLLSPSSTTNMTVVARYGVDRASNYLDPRIIGNTVAQRDGRLVCTYKYQDTTRGALAFYGDTSNWVELELEPDHQPGMAHDAGGSATIAAAYPVVWDGQETVDVSVPHMPTLFADDTGGVGPDLTGEFSFRAVYSWRDKAGNLHRSAPSLPVSLSLAGTKPTVMVTAPLIFRNGITQDYTDVTLYMTEDTGSIYYAVTALPDAGYPHTLGCYVFNAIPDTETSNDRLYSTGADNEPLVSTCPPPAWDVETIGSRQWLINAEFRNRLHPSKLKENGIAFEYAPELAIDVDRQYGKLMKVCDVGGRVLVFAERGVWSVGGYGPDNSGGGSGFSDPQLVLNTGCKYRHSVAQIPGIGVMFQAEDGRFALLGVGGGLERFERLLAYEVAAPLIHIMECEVVYPLSDGSGYIVYNWLVKGWTKWAESAEA